MPIPKEIDLSDRESLESNYQGTGDAAKVMKQKADQAKVLMSGKRLKYIFQYLLLV